MQQAEFVGEAQLLLSSECGAHGMGEKWRRRRNKLKFSSETQSVMGDIGRLVRRIQWIVNPENLERKYRLTEERRLNEVKFSSDKKMNNDLKYEVTREMSLIE